jgi:hypothetical protein
VTGEDLVTGAAAFWSPGSPISDIALPSGYAYAVGQYINNNDQIAGYVYPSVGGPQMFLYTPGAGTTVFTLPSDSVYSVPTITGMNNKGVVVGYYSDTSGGVTSFTATAAGGVTELSPSNSEYIPHTFEAEGINDAGTIVGVANSNTPQGFGGDGPWAFVYPSTFAQQGSPYDLGSNLLAINASGTAIGNGGISEGAEGVGRGFTFDGSSWAQLGGAFSGDGNYIDQVFNGGINSSGVIVGTGGQYDATLGQYTYTGAMIYDNGVFEHFGDGTGTYVDPSWQPLLNEEIGDNGAILGTAEYIGADDAYNCDGCVVIYEPGSYSAPEPATDAIMLGGLAVLFLLRRPIRRKARAN